jgi:AcrR family transcriptional regulator
MKIIMDNTKHKILEAAAEIFVNKGFSGTSISDIANKAGINQSLIYHHIGNKQALWKEVKKALIGNIENIDLAYKNLNHFIEHITDQRVALYERDPRILRIIQWQALEDQNNLIGGNQVTPINWTDAIKELQDKSEIRLDYSADFIAAYIHSLINGAIFDSLSIFSKNKHAKKQYLKMITKEMIKTLKASSV